MDISMLLVVVVAVLIVACAYLLFNDMPRLGGDRSGDRRRR